MQSTKNNIVLACLMLMLTACAGYREEDHSPLTMLKWQAAGYSEEKGPGDLIKVSYKVRMLGGATMHMTEMYALYRCAEVAQREGKPYFALYQDLPAALADRRSDKNKVTLVLGKPESYAYILLHAESGPGLLSTAEVLARLDPLVKPQGIK